MAWRPHGRININATAPAAGGCCDRCGIWYSLSDLVWQYDWRGNQIQNIKLRVCTRTCVDKPYEGWRPLKLPPDPVPVRDPRPYLAAQEEMNTPLPPLVVWDEPGVSWDEPSILWDS